MRTTPSPTVHRDDPFGGHQLGREHTEEPYRAITDNRMKRDRSINSKNDAFGLHYVCLLCYCPAKPMRFPRVKADGQGFAGTDLKLV
jgi:hypothetical protein